MPDVFISYSRKDRPAAEALCASLEERGLVVWIDWEAIPPSANWMQEIHAAIEAAAAFLFLASESSLRSKVCALELAHAVESGKRLIPVGLPGTDPRSAPAALGALNWIFLPQTPTRRHEDTKGVGPVITWEDACERIVQAVRTDLEWARFHARLLGRAAEWQAKVRDPSLLLRGQDLHQAEDRLARTVASEPLPTPLQREYLLAARRNEQQRSRRTLSAAGIALAVTLLLALLAFWQRNAAVSEAQQRATAQAAAETAEGVAKNEAATRAVAERAAVAAVSTAVAAKSAAIAERDAAEKARQQAEQARQQAISRQLAAQAEALLTTQGQLRLAVQLAAESLRRTGNPQAGLFLQRTLDRLPRPLARLTLDADIAAVAFSPDGVCLYVLDTSGTLRRIEWQSAADTAGTETARARPLVDAPGGVELKLSPDGSRLLINRWGERFVLDTLGLQTLAVLQRDAVLSPGFDRLARPAADDAGRLEIQALTLPSPVGRGKIQLLSPPGRGAGGEGFSIIQLSPDGALLAASAGQSVSVWDVSGGEAVARFELDFAPKELIFSPDGSILAASGADAGGLLAWRLADQKPLYREPAGTPAAPLQFTPDGAHMVVGRGYSFSLSTAANSGGVEKSVDVFSTSTWQATARFRMPLDGGLLLHPAGRLAAGYQGEWLYLANLNDGSILARIQTGMSIGAVAWDTSPYPAWIAAYPAWQNCPSEKCVEAAQVWDVRNFEPVTQAWLPGHGNAAYAFGPGGLLAGWDNEGRELFVWPLEPRQAVYLTSSSLAFNIVSERLSFSPDGGWLAAVSNSAAVSLFRAPGAAGTGLLAWNAVAEIADSRGAYRFRPGATAQIAAAERDGAVRLYSLAVLENDSAIPLQLKPGDEALSLPHPAPVIALEFSADGGRMVSACEDHLARAWDVAGEKETARHAHTGPIWSVKISADGTLAVSSEESSLSVWETSGGKERLHLPLSDPHPNLALSPDGAYLALAEAGHLVRLYAAGSDEQVSGARAIEIPDGSALSGSDEYRNVLFNRDGRSLLIYGSTGVLRLWDILERRERWRREFGDAIQQVELHADGQRLLAVTYNGQIAIVRPSDGEVLLDALQPLRGYPFSTAFSPDWRRMCILGIGTNLLHLMDWQPGDLLQEACARLPRSLLENEWMIYLEDEPYVQTCAGMP